MLNQIIVVGVLKEIPELKQTSTKVKYAHMKLDVRRNFKTIEGNYEHDEIEFTLWRGVAEECIDVCEVGSIVAVKGRVQSNPYTTEDKTYINYEFIAEKVTFINQ